MNFKTKASLLALTLSGVLAAGCGEGEKKENGGVVEKIHESKTETEKTVEEKNVPAETEAHHEVAPSTEVPPVQHEGAPLEEPAMETAPDQEPAKPVEETATTENK